MKPSSVSAAGTRSAGSGRSLSGAPTPAAAVFTRPEYATAFDHADVVAIRLPEAHEKVPADQQLDVEVIVKSLGDRGIEARALDDVADMTRIL